MKSGRDLRGTGRYLALGFKMVAVTAVGAGIGYWLDQRTGRQPLFLILFFILGSFGGSLKCGESSNQKTASIGRTWIGRHGSVW